MYPYVCIYVCKILHNIQKQFVYIQYKMLIIFFSFSFVTRVHTCGIYSEVFSHDSTQFSEAKTTYVLKQFVEHQ